MEVIYEYPHSGLQIRCHDEVSREMLELAEETVWGSGGIRYQVRDIEAKLKRVVKPSFVTMHVSEQLAGFYVLSGKRATMGDRSVKAYYRTFLTLDPRYRGRGYGALLAEQTKRYFLTKEPGETVLLYGYVEADNLASMNALKHAGYDSVATFRSTVFSRWHPRLDDRCRLLKRAERTEIEALLTALYQHHVLQDFDQSLAPESYWVLESQGCIVAGVQVETCHWRILRLPGITGAMLVHGISRTPVLRRMFNAQQCRFLKFGNIYALAGHEVSLFSLMESVLASSEMNSALIYFDPRCPVFARIRSSGHFGMLDAGIDAKVHVMAAGYALTMQEDQMLKQKPVIISSMDIG